ncbi:antitoxin [Avibacterium gallinarum]|nr:antitoxin [Avibacterium gallinarum]
MQGEKMKNEYDFSQGIKNPYARNLKEKKVITIRIEDDTIDYFKGLSNDTGLPYQTLINLYLKDCVEQKRKPKIAW